MEPKISVAMATCNGSRYLRQQLDTIAKQTVKPYELVVCDDGSIDETVSIINEFAASVTFRVRVVVNQKNLGFANNFLKCVGLCCGDWIAFCDQDDIWVPEKLAVIRDVISKCSEKLTLIYHRAELVDEELTPLGRRLPVVKRKQVWAVASHHAFWFVGGCVMCFKASLLSDIDSSLRPRDNYRMNEGWLSDRYPWMPHDKWVCMLANMCGEVASLTDVLSLYRRHPTAATGAHENTGVAARIKNASMTGSEAYDFLSQRSYETSESLLNICGSLIKGNRKTLMEYGADSFKDLGFNFKLRSELYSSRGIFKRSEIFISMIRRRAYKGNAFVTLGFSSLIKDIFVTIGISGSNGVSAFRSKPR